MPVMNNPLSYIDPTGLKDCASEADCAGEDPYSTTVTASVDDAGTSTSSLNGCSIFSMFCAPDFLPPSNPPTRVPANNGSFTKTVLPEGPYTNVCRSGQVTFLAPASFDMSAIVAAGNAGGLSPSAANAAVGQYGTFDFQRYANSAGDTVFYSGYTNVSNFGVGAYLSGTGVPQWAASGIANTFALFKSSNAGDPNQATYRNAGYS